MDISRVLTVEKPFPVNKRGRIITVPSWMLRREGEQPPVDNDEQEQDSIDALINSQSNEGEDLEVSVY